MGLNDLHTGLKVENDGSGMEGDFEGVKNSPGRQRVVPHTISTAVEEMSSLRAVRIPRRTRGRASIQESG